MLQIDKYAYTNPLKNIHPLEKSVFCFSFLFFSLVTKDTLIALITFSVMSTMSLVGVRVAWRNYLKLLMLPFFFLMTSVMTLLISFSPVDVVLDHPLWSMSIASWQIYMSFESINRGFQMICTVMACISCMYFFILTTPLPQMIWIMQKVKVPQLFIELVMFTYRFIFVLLEKVQEIYVAQSSRLGYESYRVWISSLAQLVVALLIKTMQSARELQIAMDSRGGEDPAFQVQINLPYKLLHWIVMGGSMIVLITLS